MILTIGNIRAEIARKKHELKETVFEHPPADWEGFKQLLGRYQELVAMDDFITTRIHGNEEEK